MLSDTFAYWIYEDGVLYFGRRVDGTSSYVAIDAQTGKEKWNSGLGKTYDAWKGSGVYNMGNKIVFSTASALIAIDKKNGKKLYRTKLSDYNLSVRAIVRGTEFIIQGSKSRSMAFYHYDMNTGELAKTTSVAKGMEEVHNKINYLLLGDGKITEGELHEYEVWVAAEESMLTKDVYTDDRKLYIEGILIEMPDYRGDCRIWSTKKLNNGIYIALQAKGLEYGAEKTALLHLIY